MLRPVHQRRPRLIPGDEMPLKQRIIALASEYGRHGYRRITASLCREGWRLSPQGVERIWRQEGLKVPKKQPKRGRLWLDDGSCIRRRLLHRDHVWSYDFVADRTHSGRPIRMLTVIDECLAIEVQRRLSSQDVLDVLRDFFVQRGAPDFVRLDTGPEFATRSVRDWLGRVAAQTLFIDPRSSWENGYNESLSGKLRDGLLVREIFFSLREAQVLVEAWRVQYISCGLTARWAIARQHQRPFNQSGRLTSA